jgi:hypothetical protein
MKKSTFFDFNHPFYLPKWRRYATVAVCLAWLGVEWALGSPFWGVIAAGVSGMTFHGLILNFDEEEARKRAAGDKNA